MSSGLTEALLRGKLVRYDLLQSTFFVGELDVSILNDPMLIPLRRETDMSGYFLLNLKSGEVISGMSHEEFELELRTRRMNVEDVKFRPDSYFDRVKWMCFS